MILMDETADEGYDGCLKNILNSWIESKFNLIAEKSYFLI